jgi:hypothetical protein
MLTSVDMNEQMEFVLRAVLIGTGATMVMDAWALALRRLGIASLNFALLGRWIGHWRDGQWMHETIGRSAPVRGERLLGWGAHYTIGITFAALLLSIVGLPWARSPSLGPAMIVGLATVIAPLFVLQPALGLGALSSRTPRPLFNSLKSVATHGVYGLGLYLTALATASLLGGAH